MSYVSRKIHTRHVVAPSVTLQVVIVTLRLRSAFSTQRWSRTLSVAIGD